jgi:hypothetical protein
VVSIVRVVEGRLSVSGGLSSARSASVVAMSAALYAVFFFLSGFVAVPSFVVLYLPVVLLGVFPVWFGLPGLVGSMIGAVVGGVFGVENLGFAAWIEAVTTFIIFALNWVLMPRNAVEGGRRSFAKLLGVYALTLFVGTAYVLWQLAFIGVFPMEFAFLVLLPSTFALNYVIEVVICPVLLRVVSPKLKVWGLYSGNFWEWRQRRKSRAVAVV